MTWARASVRWRPELLRVAGATRRRASCLTLLGLFLLAGAAARSAASPATTDGTAAERAAFGAALQRCARRLDADRDVGVERILRSCAELESWWARPSAARWMPTGWRDAGADLSAGSLRELAALLADADAPDVAGTPLAPAALQAALADVAGDADDEPGLLRRLLRWVRALVASEREADPAGDLLDWVDSGLRAQRFWTLLGWIAFGAVLLLVGWIVRGELRAAGWPRRAPRLGDGPMADDASPASATVDVALLPLRERPGSLLRGVAAELEARGALVRAAAATPRQMLQAEPFADALRAAQLRELGNAAEAVRYAAAEPDAATLERASDAGMALLASLRGAAPVAAS